MLVHRINVRLSDREFERFERERADANLSRSAFFRCLLMRKRIPSSRDFDAIKDLLTVNADLARLGSLQKLCMSEIVNTDIPERDVQVAALNSLKNQIRERQAELRVLAAKIKT